MFKLPKTQKQILKQIDETIELFGLGFNDFKNECLGMKKIVSKNWPLTPDQRKRVIIDAVWLKNFDEMEEYEELTDAIVDLCYELNYRWERFFFLQQSLTKVLTFFGL